MTVVIKALQDEQNRLKAELRTLSLQKSELLRRAGDLDEQMNNLQVQVDELSEGIRKVGGIANPAD